MPGDECQYRNQDLDAGKSRKRARQEKKSSYFRRKSFCSGNGALILKHFVRVFQQIPRTVKPPMKLGGGRGAPNLSSQQRLCRRGVHKTELTHLQGKSDFF